MKTRAVPLVLWLLAMSIFLAIVRHTHVTTDMSAFLPKGASQAERVMIGQVKDGAVSRTLIAGIENVPLEVATALDRRMGEALAADPAFATIVDGDRTLRQADTMFVWKKRYLLSPHVTPEQFSETGLRQALEADLAQLGSTAGVALKQTLPADPTQEITAILQGLTSNTHPRLQDGILVSPDGKRALMILETTAAGADLDGQEQAQAALQGAFDAAKEAMPEAASARLVYSGPGVFAVHARNGMKKSTTRVSAIATVLVAALLLAAYRSPLQLGLSLLPVASGVLAGMAAVAARFGFVHGITLGFGVTLIGEAVDYAVYYFATASDRAALARLWPILTLGMGTSVAGFSAMLFSGFQGFAQLGLFTIAGLLTALIVTRFVLPALVAKSRPIRTPAFTFLHPPRRRRTHRGTSSPAELATIMGSPPARGMKMKNWLVVVSLAGAVIVIALHPGSLWQESLDSLSPVPASEQAQYRSLRADVGQSDDTLSLLVTAPTQEDTLQAAEALRPQLAALQDRGMVKNISSPADLLPSQAAQRARQAAIPDPETLKAALDKAATGLPFKPGLFAPFLADAQAARTEPFITQDSYAGTSLRLKLQAQLFQTGADWNAMIVLGAVTDKAVLQTLTAAAASIALLDMKALSRQLLQTYRGEALTLAGAGSCAIAILLLIALRSLRRTARVLLPLACSVTVTFAALLLVAHSLSIFHLFGLLLTVAVGSNYCLFLERSASGEERGRTLSALVLANLCTVIGFGVLSLSTVPVLQGIGSTVALGALLSLLFGMALIRPGERA